MSLVLMPAVYRCPDHDNYEIVTARVRELVERESHTVGRASSDFRVAVTCPGSARSADTAHRRVYDGRWSSD